MINLRGLVLAEKLRRNKLSQTPIVLLVLLVGSQNAWPNTYSLPMYMINAYPGVYYSTVVDLETAACKLWNLSAQQGCYAGALANPPYAIDYYNRYAYDYSPNYYSPGGQPLGFNFSQYCPTGQLVFPFGQGK